MNKRDAAFKGKLDGKFTKFYILCNLKMSMLHFKNMYNDLTVTGPFYCFPKPFFRFCCSMTHELKSVFFAVYSSWS